jgi:sterol 14alpha-demethylase
MENKVVMQSPPKMSKGLPFLGHMMDYAKNPAVFLTQVRTTLGEIGEFKLFHQKMVLLTGSKANEAFFRLSDEQFSQKAAYKMMVPIFGKGIVFDAPLPIKEQQFKIIVTTLRDNPSLGHTQIISSEVNQALQHWGENGEIDMLDFMTTLTLYTSTHCLLGTEFRHELDKGVMQTYHDLEKGMIPLATVFPYFPIPTFFRRDKARIRFQALISDIIAKRAAQPEKKDDSFQTLIESTYDDGTPLSDYEITGLLLVTIMGGHKTTLGVVTWVILELIKHPTIMQRVLQELNSVFDETGNIMTKPVRKMPLLENVIKEALRLHPPLIFLIRQLKQDLYYKNYVVKAGNYVCTSPHVSHFLPELFSNPHQFDPDRYNNERQEDATPFSWIPFGGGKHKCSGSGFAMLQMKVIVSILLYRYQFELVDAPESYQDDFKQMVVKPKSPCRLRYTKRTEKISGE